MASLISTEEPAHSVQGAESLLGKHGEYRAEIDAREESMNVINKTGKKLVQQGHYASAEVRDGCHISHLQTHQAVRLVMLHTYMG